MATMSKAESIVEPESQLALSVATTKRTPALDGGSIFDFIFFGHRHLS
jgi:hypothetical protein